ncbi:MAG TPA: ATP-binding protein [Acidobacteriaceae bacterium]
MANPESHERRPSPKRILLSWSGGKDSAWALHLLRQQPEFEVVALLTTLNEKFRRVAIHGFREELLDQQAASIGLPLWKVDLPFPCSNADYESRMAQVCARASAEGLYGIAFGDLFLEDIRAYRIEKLAGTGLEPIFPVWCPSLGISTAELARQMIAAGFRAHLTCIDPRYLDRSFAGRTFDAQLLADLPASVDPCGERGEFHSFAFAGPIFSRTLSVLPGETVERDNFIYADLLPTQRNPTPPETSQLQSASPRLPLPAPDSSLRSPRPDAGASGSRRLGPRQ